MSACLDVSVGSGHVNPALALETATGAEEAISATASASVGELHKFRPHGQANSNTCLLLWLEIKLLRRLISRTTFQLP